MSSKFFTNREDNTLFQKIVQTVEGVKDFAQFLAVVGYFRSSGYAQISQLVTRAKTIRVLVGIDVDSLTATLAQNTQPSLQQILGVYGDFYQKDIEECEYSEAVERGIEQMIEDLHSGRLELRIYRAQNLHAKFYLFLPEEHTGSSDGRVITGSSNLSESGLGIRKPQQYELNVELRDYDDVHFCHEEFKALWGEGVEISGEHMQQFYAKTHLGQTPTPWELYMKVLIEYFGEQVENDFSIKLPEGIKEYSYQKDAAVQGLQMLKRHNGFILGDVVGLGKTIVAAMIAKRFVEENGALTRILVVYPPAVEGNWKKTFRQFGFTTDCAQFVSNGSLGKVLLCEENYLAKELYDLVIVDESHGFRNDDSTKYDELQQICKAERSSSGRIGGAKKVMLLTATPLNNGPRDLYNQIRLFQDDRNSTIDGLRNLQGFFNPRISCYQALKAERSKAENLSEEVDRLYQEIRDRVLRHIIVRRTRTNILHDPKYRQEIQFPAIAPPCSLEYPLGLQTAQLFAQTFDILVGGGRKEPKLAYARYKVEEFFVDGIRSKSACVRAVSLAGIYKTILVKRLESSFYAFRETLRRLLLSTQQMLEMLEEDKVLVLKTRSLIDLLEKGMELDEIIEKFEGSDECEVFSVSQFRPEFRDALENDKKLLEKLIAGWENVNKDPKLEQLILKLPEILRGEGRSGKVVIFSESVDTLKYLEEELKKRLKRDDILRVDAKNRKSAIPKIAPSFDASYEGDLEGLKEYNILLSSDVLSEGVNLHRCNVVVHYDTPWNATKLMQRNGRVNRVGTTAKMIYNYLFYPSSEGDRVLGLYANALMKMQGFHTALGEDAKIYSNEEITRELKLYDPQVKDQVDEQLELLREVRTLYRETPERYEAIKGLPGNSRTSRRVKDCEVGHPAKGKETVVFLSTPGRVGEFYLAKGGEAKSIDIYEAVRYLRVEESLEGSSTMPSWHYRNVELAKECHARGGRNVSGAEGTLMPPSESKQSVRDRHSKNALSKCQRRCVRYEPDIAQCCERLRTPLALGMYSQLGNELIQLDKQLLQKAKTISPELAKEVLARLQELVQKYGTARPAEQPPVEYACMDGNSSIILSENFI